MLRGSGLRQGAEGLAELEQAGAIVRDAGRQGDSNQQRALPCARDSVQPVAGGPRAVGERHPRRGVPDDLEVRRGSASRSVQQRGAVGRHDLLRWNGRPNAEGAHRAGAVEHQGARDRLAGPKVHGVDWRRHAGAAVVVPGLLDHQGGV